MDKEQKLDAAVQFQVMRDALKRGPFYTGDLSDGGYVIEEPLRAPVDHIKRYTDRYLHTRRIGNTTDTFPFKVEFFPEELQKAIGHNPGTTKKRGQKPVVDVETAVKAAENDENNDDEETSDNDQEENVEDEFEELEDDDYNAEKYFDDGDDYGDGDDDGGEAAY